MRCQCGTRRVVGASGGSDTRWETHPHHSDNGSRHEPNQPDQGVTTPPAYPALPGVGIVERWVRLAVVIPRVFAVDAQQRRPRAQHRPAFLTLKLGYAVESTHIFQANLAGDRFRPLHLDVVPRARLVHVSRLARAPE